MSNTEITQLRERLAALESTARRVDADRTITSTINTYRATVPTTVLDRVMREASARELPITEAGTVDHAALAESVRTLVRNEVAYLQGNGARFGMPRDLGESRNGNEGETAAAITTDLEAGFRALGMSESAAKLAASGRD